MFYIKGCALLAVPLTILLFLFRALYYACFVEETLAILGAVKIGAEDLVGITRERYTARLMWLKELLRLGVFNTRDERAKTSYARVVNALESLKLDRADGTIRKQPFCIMIEGYPGCGKTGAAIRLAEACMRSRYGKFTPDMLVTLNESDEYQSEFRTSHKVVIFDDIGAAKLRQNNEDPWRKIIDFVNNVRKTSLNPNVEMKGNVYIDCDMVIMTTNTTAEYRWNSSAFLGCTSALIRRVALIIKPDSNRQSFKWFVPRLGHPQEKGGFYEYSFDVKESDKYASIGDFDDLKNSVTKQFSTFMKDQEDHVLNINSIFDPVIQPTAWDGFVEDVMLPFWPIVPCMDMKEENELPFWHRLYRKVCIKRPILEAQSGVLPVDKSQRPSDGESKNSTAIKFIQKYLDRDVYCELKSRIIPSSDYWIGYRSLHEKVCGHLVLPGGTLVPEHYPGLQPMFPGSVIHEAMSLLEIPDENSIEEDSLVLSETTEEKSTNKSLEVINTTLEEAGERVAARRFPISDFVRKEVARFRLTKRSMRQMVAMETLLRESNVGGTLLTNVSGFITGVIALSAAISGGRDLQLECAYPSDNYDLAFTLDTIPVIVEAKTLQDPILQTLKYMRANSNATLFGLAVNVEGYTIYARGVYSPQTLSKLQLIADRAYRFLTKKRKNKLLSVLSYGRFEPLFDINDYGPFIDF